MVVKFTLQLSMTGLHRTCLKWAEQEKTDVKITIISVYSSINTH